MKIIVILLLVCSLNHDADGSIFWDAVSEKFSDMASYVSGSIKSLSTKVQSLIVNRAVANNAAFLDDVSEDQKLKSAFNELVLDRFADFEPKVHKSQEVKEIDYKNLDPSMLLETPQLALWHKRKMESHIVQTKDGYFLTVHRLVVDPEQIKNRTVLLHHGILGSSTDWILLGPSKSLPYILADAGYDVWLTNARGNYYSRGHMSRRLDCIEYWKFSWQEMGLYDIPAVLDHIRKTKNSYDPINFIGHSMGATALLVLLSTYPKYNAYFRVGILLAPLAYMNHVRGPMKVLTSVSDELIKLMGEGEFLPSRKVPSWLANSYCNGLKIYCTNPLLFLSGIPNHKSWNASFIARLLHHIPAGGSTNTLLHYLQVAHSGKFHRFNRDTSEFEFHNITLPIAVFSSPDDWLASKTDVLKLVFSLPNPIDHHIINHRKMTHTDFVWGPDANVFVFSRILEYLENGLWWHRMRVIN